LGPAPEPITRNGDGDGDGGGGDDDDDDDDTVNDGALVAERMATTKMTTAKRIGDVLQIYAATWSE
jgi:hypothetical protein